MIAIFPEHVQHVISHELDQARKALAEQNPGKARVCCRRAIGAAMTGAPRQSGQRSINTLSALDILIADVSAPEDARHAAYRLRSRATPQEQASMSATPIEDAEIILRYLVTFFQTGG